jgi:hypothetical protein
MRLLCVCAVCGLESLVCDGQDDACDSIHIGIVFAQRAAFCGW